MTANGGVRVGIQAMSAYLGSSWVNIQDVFEARGLDMARYANIGVRAKGVALPDEDVVALAATAAWPVVNGLDDTERSRIRGVIVATESGVDMSKAVSAYLHGLLDLPRGVRLFEIKQACYGGVAALQTAAALVATEPSATVLVVAADLPTVTRGSYIEASQGVGGVAALVGAEPTLVELELGTSGCCGYDGRDVVRPAPETEVVDTDLSLMAYLDCMVGAVNDHLERSPGRDITRSFDLLAMHTPFPGMVRGSHRTLMRRLSDLDRAGVEDDFNRRVTPSLVLPSRAGNIYSACALLATLSTIANAPREHDQTLGVFSYGSGSASEFFAARILAGAAARVADVGRALDDRTRLSVDEYDGYVDRTALRADRQLVDRDEFAKVSLPGRPRASLTGITNHRREYAWVNGD